MTDPEPRPADPALDATPTGPTQAPPPGEATPPADRAGGPSAPPRPRPRPMIERIGLALVAAVLAALFVVVALASFAGGEPFLGVMAAIGCLMVVWVGGLTLFKGQ